MFSSIGLPVLAVLFAAGILLFVPAIFYVRMLKRALELCSLESRTMSPGKVWLVLIPLFGEIWQFLVVIDIAKSLHNEFSKRGLPAAPAPGQAIGLSMCVLTLAGMVPVIGTVASIASLGCWLLYWRKISHYMRLLEGAVPVRAN